VSENPNIQPDPNAGQPPGGPAGQPAQPTTPPSSTPEPTPTTPTTPTTPAATPKTAAGVAAGAAAAAGQPGSEPAGAQEPAAENPTSGAFTESPWVGPDAEHPEEIDSGAPADPNAPNTGVAATFLPGIDAAAVLALVVAALAAGVYLLVNPLVQAHDAARTWSDFKNNVPRTKQDPFGVQRDWVNYQSWGFIILGLVAVLLALLVLGMWTAQRNKLRSRTFAQAALVVGLAVVLYGILLKTGAVGSTIPSMKEISNGLSTTQ